MIYIASDHAGFEAKEKIFAFLESAGYEVIDLGPESFDKSDDYPPYAFKLGEEVVRNDALGIIICGSGIGVTIAANKVKGARAGYVESKEHAIKAKEDDNTNILVLDNMTFDPAKDFAIIETWINTPFSEAERHRRRVQEIIDYESK